MSVLSLAIIVAIATFGIALTAIVLFLGMIDYLAALMHEAAGEGWRV